MRKPAYGVFEAETASAERMVSLALMWWSSAPSSGSRSTQAALNTMSSSAAKAATAEAASGQIVVGGGHRGRPPSRSLLRPQVSDLAGRLRGQRPQLVAEAPESIGLVFPA